MDIYHTLFWGCAALCAVAELLILRAVFRPAPDAAPGAAGVPQSPQGVEFLWSMLPVFALGALFWATWQAVL